MNAGILLYELSSQGSSSPVVLAQVAVDSNSYDSLADLYYNLFGFLTAQFSETLGEPHFSDGMANPKYPAGYKYDFISLWHHAGLWRYIGLYMLSMCEFRDVAGSWW
jgi:hypothetical protein